MTAMVRSARRSMVDAPLLSWHVFHRIKPRGAQRRRGGAARGGVMAARPAELHPRLLILFSALWVLSAGQLASAQVPLPPNFISPDVPHDVPAGANGIQDLAVFAWREFIALNWVAMDPATTNMRGRPNTNADFLGIKADSNGNFPLLVWQTYQHKNELFPANGQTASSFDSKGPTTITRLSRVRVSPIRLTPVSPPRARHSASSTILMKRVRLAWPKCMHIT